MNIILLPLPPHHDSIEQTGNAQQENAMKTPQQEGLKWLFLDFNSYFASIEQQVNPHLRNRPVAVVPMLTDSTCVIAASYEAKAFGVKTGTSVHEAKRLCPDLTCVQANHKIYTEYHYRLIAEISRHTPIFKEWSIDELSSRLPINKRNEPSIRKLAANIKQGIWDNVGSAINCSIGIAPNSYLAKIASDMNKPDGLTILHPDTMHDKLFRLKLTDLTGINTNMERRLNGAGIWTIEKFCALQPKHARSIWGGIAGERFWYNLHGYNVPDKQTQRRVIGHSRVLEPLLRPEREALTMARRLLSKAASRLRREEFYATALDLSIRLVTGEKVTLSAKIAPSQDNFTFLKRLGELWHDANIQGRTCKKVAVALHGLCKSEQITPDLFDTRTEDFQKLQSRHATLSTTIDDLNQKFGAGTIGLGKQPDTSGVPVGSKIAFSRVPTMAEFNE